MLFSKLCTPALIYAVAALISLAVAFFKRFELISLLSKGLFIAVWTWFLNYLCSKGYKTISWVLVLLPFILMLGIFVIASEVVKKQPQQQMQQQKQQQQY